MKHLKLTLLLLLYFATILNVEGQYHFTQINKTNGLSHNNVECIYKDSKDFMWFGTYQNGLNKFDRKTNKFTHYGSAYGIGDQVYRIKVLKDGTLCIGSSNGLALYNDSTDEFKSYRPDDSKYSLNSYLISDLLEMTDNQIYIATWEGDIQRFDRATGYFYSIPLVKSGLQQTAAALILLILILRLLSIYRTTKTIRTVCPATMFIHFTKITKTEYG